MRIRYLARAVTVLDRSRRPSVAYPGGGDYPPPGSSKPRTITYRPGLVDVDVFPELEQWCDSREIEQRADGAWRFKAKDA